MAIRERAKALKGRVSQLILHPLNVLARQILRGLFRLSIARRQTRGAAFGFVLPTTILLLLVLSLAVGSISLRTISRTQQVVGDRAQRVIYNAATPAIDRAKAKIAYLIERHEKNTPGIPPEDELVKMMLNRETGFADESVDDSGNRFTDIYTFDTENNPDIVDPEERLDVDGDGQPDNAWIFQSDTDGDEQPDSWVAYSIIFETPNPIPDDPNDPDDIGLDTIDALRNIKDEAIAERAKNLEVRNGPRSLLGSGERCPAVQQGSVEEGWFSDESNTVFLRKNFQINAVVIPGVRDGQGNLLPNQNATVSTLEMQQDRTFDVGNKWGAWFQNDLEIFPGPPFNWNGAMRTQGSLVLGKETFSAYLVSSKYSCFNIDKSASEVRVGENIIAGQVDGVNNADAPFHVFTEFGNDPLGANGNISINDDGVDGDTVDYQTPADIGDVLLLDPVKTFLQGRAPIAGEAADGNPLRDNPDDFASITINEWDENREIADRITVASARSDAPVNYGDTYRNDHRAGPTPITGPDVLEDQGDWEELAHQEGIRVLVGQRLELGLPNALPDGESIANAGGVWDSFWSIDSCEEADNTIGGGVPRCHEARQRVALRDKLAAVQATAVYRADVTTRPFRDDGNTPLACLATTVHPGTAETLKRSATYHNFNDDVGGLLRNSTTGAPFLAVEDFFTGRGTNGWEFEPPSAVGDPVLMETALRNLANFAGDPRAGAPYFEAIQDDYVHPYPAMAMWGDFSLLRRIVNQRERDPNALADDTIRHTAECLVGMLAHNISYLNSDRLQPGAALPAISGDLVQALLALDTTSALPATDPRFTGANAPAPAILQDNSKEPEAFIWALEQWQNPPAGSGITANPNVTDGMIRLARFLTAREQIRRDRDYGFDTGGSTNTVGGRIGCEERFSGDGLGALGILCSNNPRYPVLYSLFPGDTNQNGITGNVSGTDFDRHFETQAGRGFDPNLPLPDQTATTTDDNYLLSASNPLLGNNPQGANLAGVNDRALYEVFTDQDIEKIALDPIPMNQWVLPHQRSADATVANGAPNSATDVLIRCEDFADCDGEFVRVGFKDAAMMDGRQLMNVRVMDLNMDLLRDGGVTIAQRGGDTWLPSENSALLYLFREDAVREDGIVRPVDPARDIPCINDVEVRKPECWLQAGDVSVFDSTDPRLVAMDPDPEVTGDEYQASIKSVDYWTDPDRRPFGFRLRNGEDLSRSRASNINESISLISDQPIYILGDFNKHDAYGGGELQEFQGGNNVLDFNNFNFNRFYNRGEALGSADARFAASNSDQWRPTEVFADAVTILSNNFCDGSIEDLYIYSRDRGQLPALAEKYGCPVDPGYTSYTNFTRLDNFSPIGDWIRDNPIPGSTDQYDDGAPIEITASGNPRISATGAPFDTRYDSHVGNRSNHIITADETTVNAGIYSAIVPSRTLQSYGGLHNFPRLIEDWDNQIPLNISGAFFQLGFSTYSTAAYDNPGTSWEPDVLSVANLPELVTHTYYKAARRNWGYDVALQKNPPGKVASRFIEQTPIVSEFYTEPAIEDPYTSQLCRAIARAENIEAVCPPEPD